MGEGDEQCDKKHPRRGTPSMEAFKSPQLRVDGDNEASATDDGANKFEFTLWTVQCHLCFPEVRFDRVVNPTEDLEIQGGREV
ncbi:hypothetical protein KM043_017839 [Ampulex compressa]|nr:hypothetical protein KM043_017839 [Ampulex compressa]